VTDFNAGSFSFDTDENDARREADKVFDAFEKRMNETFRLFTQGFSEAFADLRRGFSGDAFQNFTRGARAAKEAVLENDDAIKVLADDIRALDTRFRAFFNTAQTLGQDPGLLAAYERELRRLFELQRRLESEDFSDALGARRLAGIQATVRAVERGLISERTLQQSHSRDLNTLARQQEVSARNIRDNASRERVASLNAERARFVTATQLEGAQRLAETRVAGQRQIAQERATQRTRIELLRFTLTQIRALERTLGNVFSGVGAVASGATRRVAQALSNLGDSLRRNNREFSDGLAPALNRRETLISNSFRQQEISVSRSILRQQQTLERFEQQSRRGIAGAVTGQSVAGRGLAGLGLGIGGGLAGGALLAGGFQRFSNLERLTKQFEALTGSIETAQVLLDEVAAFAKTTPFDLVGVADLAKGFLAIGTAAEDVIPRVKVIADAVALTGGNADSLVRIQRAIGQVVSAGRLQGDELNQLAENLPGLNIRQILADQLTGGNVQQLVELQEAGKLTADKFVDGLLTGLGNDPRLVGASEDLAKTLSGRVANLRESFEDFGASLIGLIANPLRSAVLISQTVLQGLSDFIKGDVTGALDILRTAAGGAAIALGGLLAARAAGEAIQFLGLALRSALTPFGIFALAVAGIGAALAVLLQRSPEVREAFSALGEAVGNILAPAMEFAAGVLEDFTNLLTRTVLPGLEQFAISVAQRIGPALERIGLFIGETVLPALQRFTEFVLDTAIPAVRDGLATAFNVARGAASAFWEFVEPIIQPAIDGFSALGSAIRDVIGGDFSNLLPALGGVARGIGSTFANIGQLIFNGLREPVLNAFNFLKDTFSGDNLRALGLGFLDLVEQVGFVLANIVTDRRVVTGLAAIAAAAGVTALRFVQGLARGILDNLPDLLDALRDLGVLMVRELASAIVDNPEILLFAFAALLVGSRILTVFRNAGAAWGKAASEGFVSRLRSTLTGANSSTRFASDFIGGLFGGRTGIANALERQRRDIVKSVQQNQRDLIALTGKPLTGIGKFDTSALQRTNQEIKTITGNIGKARAAGVLFADSFGRSVEAVRTRNLGALRQSIGDMARQIAPAAQAAGAAVGNALVAGIGAALSGQQLGTATSGTGQAIGIAGIISSALFASTLGGGPLSPVGAAIGGVTLAVGGLTAALSANAASAEKASGEIREYVDALLGAENAADRRAAASSTVLQNLRDEEGRTVALLDAAGFNADRFGQQILSGADGASAAFGDLIDGLGGFDDASIDTFSELERQLKIYRDEARASLPATQDFVRNIEALGFSVDDVLLAIDFLSDESGELNKALSEESALRNIADRTKEYAEALEAARGSGVNLGAGLRVLFTNISLVQGIARGTRDAIAAMLDQARTQRADSLNTTINNIETSLDRVRTKADNARTAVTEFFTSRAGGATNDAVLAAEGIGQALQDATAGVGGAIIDEARRNTALGDFAAQIQGIINEGFASGAIDAFDTDKDIYAALIPLSEALDELRRETITDPITGEVKPVITQETRDQLGALITEAIQNEEFQAEVKAVFDAETLADTLQRDLELYEFELKATLTFDDLETANSVAEQLRSAGLTPGISNVPAALGTNQIGQLGLGGLPGGVNIEAINIDGAREPVRVARETVRQLALQGARGGTAVRES
jgi:tape measure domain-containing protein